ncbi:MAG: hypothetical protein EA382_12645 [Spirochaetaceae bacterium]|nr:MAG: hypothetical protein EA382_12645 [Spirochaetaceae bacterium]
MGRAVVKSNPFIDYLAAHPGADESALKELFRILAKRTHPDLGAADGETFVRLQNAYHEALARLIGDERAARRPVAAPGGGRARSASSGACTPRDAMLRELYRYKARLPSVQLDPGPLSAACIDAFAAAVTHAQAYHERAYQALRRFDSAFHEHRTTHARYPDVRTKYTVLVKGLSAFFDYQVMPNAFNKRVARSYLAEIRPVDDYDPYGPPALRSNRSAAARSALYQMRELIDQELDLKPSEAL